MYAKYRLKIPIFRLVRNIGVFYLYFTNCRLKVRISEDILFNLIILLFRFYLALMLFVYIETHNDS